MVKLKNREESRCSGELFFFCKKKSFEMMELSSKSVIFVEEICRSVNKKPKYLQNEFWYYLLAI